MTVRKKLWNSYETAHHLAFDVPAQKPGRSATAEERERARAGLKAFYEAIKEGGAPKPDMVLGKRRYRWEPESVERFIAERKTQSKRGRPAKAEVTDAA